MRKLGSALVSPGIFRLFLAGLVVLQHLGVAAFGTAAVYIFFILSGFWISSMWENKYQFCRSRYTTFLISRFWRIAPVYLLCLGLMALVLSFVSVRWPEIAASVRSPLWQSRALALVNSSAQLQILPPAWSLDIEMQLYLLAPLLMTFLGRSVFPNDRHRGCAALVMIVLSLAIRLYKPGVHIGSYAAFFLVGMVIFQMGWKPSQRLAVGSLVVLAIVLGCAYLHPGLSHLFGGDAMRTSNVQLHELNDHASIFLAFLLVPYIIYSGSRRPSSLDRHLGNLAFPVYLFHYIPMIVLENSARAASLGRFAWMSLDLVAVVIGSVTIYLLVDCPLERMRRRFVTERVRSF